MTKRLLKPLALFIALSFQSGGAIAALGERACIYHGAADGTHTSHSTPASAGVHTAAESESGDPGHDHLADSSEGEDEHGGNCSCLGQCLGGVAPPAFTGAETLHVPSVTNSDRTPELSDAGPLRVQPPFLLPFANAPPAVS